MLVVFVGLALAISVGAHQLNPGFISIDCGASSDYIDEDLKIYYQTDEGFVSTGTNMQVSSQQLFKDLDSDANRQQFQTMRVFPNGTRNCYTLTPNQGKGNTYLIRASFRYGNYDGKNQAPSFDLHIDVNHWATLLNMYNYEDYELIYVPPRDDIKVCLVNTGLGFPFISALELRLLDNATYGVGSGALALLVRRYFNGNYSGRIRHPDDEYDRRWMGDIANPLWERIIATNYTTSHVGSSSRSSNDTYKVPEQALKTATQSLNTSLIVGRSWDVLPTEKWYMFLHFAEFQVLQQNQVRELGVFVLDDKVIIATLRPQFGKPVTVFNSFPVSSETGFMSFSVRSTAKSDLPPILNAAEALYTIDLSNTMTALDDVNTVNDIRRTYNVKKDSWQGDPCVPYNYTWNGLQCSYTNNNDHPKIISLNLSSNGLTGSIALSFSSLSALKVLDLSHNQLTGKIPEYFADMTNLKFIDLSGNSLSGPVPNDLLKRVAQGTLNISFDDYLGHSLSSSPEKEKLSIGFPIILVISILSLCVILLLIALVLIWRFIQKKKMKQNRAGAKVAKDATGLIKLENRCFTYSEIISITADFKETIGRGGFGEVYHGILENSDVAVKILSPMSNQGSKEFKAEAQILLLVYHKNLVSLRGYCDRPEHLALIYEYMANGNLRQHLSADHRASVLSWKKRVQIAVEAAEGLDYLHNGCRPAIIHRDLKTTNILLNEQMHAKLADFGLSRAFSNEGLSSTSTLIAGTLGYMDPDPTLQQQKNKLTKKSDIYSFGIILFELITGLPVLKFNPDGNGIYILHTVNALLENGDIRSIVDPRLEGQLELSSAWKMVDIANSCALPTTVERPDIRSVLTDLIECWTRLEMASGGGREVMVSNMLMRSRERDDADMLGPEIQLDSVPSAR